ncbi:20532_t:CDS:1, partial [Gigaspora rosea]
SEKNLQKLLLKQIENLVGRLIEAQQLDAKKVKGILIRQAEYYKK